jgi:predicted RND superfamily exporter protein
MIVRLITTILRHRTLAFALIALSLILSAAGASRIRVRFSHRDFWAYDANPDAPTFERYTREFGDPGGHVVVVLQSDDIFRSPNLEYVAQLSRDLAPNPLFSHIRSLSTVRIPRGAGDSVETGVLMESVPATPRALADLRNTVMQSRLLSRTLISKDGTTTAILAEMRVPTAMATVAQESEAIEAVRGALAKRPPPPDLAAVVTGGPSVEVAATRALVRDQMILSPAVIAVILLALAVTFRSPHGVVVAMGTLGVSVAWTFGIFGLLKHPIDMVNSSAPTLILVYGVVDPVFVVTRYLHKVQRSTTSESAIVDTLREMALPCFLTSLTTALGFAAFTTATMPTVRYVGIIVAIGVAFSFVTTLTVLPLLLSIVPPPKRSFSSLSLQSFVDRALQRSWTAVNRHRGPVLACGATILALGIVAGRGLRIDNGYVDTVPNGPERRAVRLLEQELSGVLRFVAYFEGPPESMRRPEVLHAIAEVDATAEAEPIVNTSSSLPDLLAEMNQAFEGEDPREYRVPSSPSLIAQYLTLVDPVDRADFVDESYSRTHIRILATDRGGLAAAHLRDVLQRKLADQHFERFGIHASLTGNGAITYRELDRMVVEMLWGFVIAFVIVVVTEFIVFRSLRIALASVLPNLMPLGGCFLTMRLFGANFRIDTSLVLSVSIGALFNTTIQIIARIRLEISAGAFDPDDIIERALRAVGPASLYTAVILSAGCSILLLSGFPGLRMLGLLAVVTMFTAFFSDAVFTTTLMRLVYDWRLKPAPSVSTPHLESSR